MPCHNPSPSKNDIKAIELRDHILLLVDILGIDIPSDIKEEFTLKKCLIVLEIESGCNMLEIKNARIKVIASNMTYLEEDIDEYEKISENVLVKKEIRSLVTNTYVVVPSDSCVLIGPVTEDDIKNEIKELKKETDELMQKLKPLDPSRATNAVNRLSEIITDLITENKELRER